jgi:NAD(P)-dependent dehydrogenase (short-subunit alcohol dehydrogenase family)
VTNSLRLELAGQHTQVVGVHAGLIDTDMVSDMSGPKVTPVQVARRIIDGVESGAAEVLADDISVSVKAALAGPVENLSFALSH